MFHLQCLREFNVSDKKLGHQAKQYLELFESRLDSTAQIKQFQDFVYKDVDLRWMVEAETEQAASSLQGRDKLIARIYDDLNQAFIEELTRRLAIQTEKGIGRSR